jgi:hypothetical protein
MMQTEKCFEFPIVTRFRRVVDVAMNVTLADLADPALCRLPIHCKGNAFSVANVLPNIKDV